MSVAGFSQTCPANVDVVFADINGEFAPGGSTLFIISDNQVLENAKYQVFCNGTQISQGCAEIQGLNGQSGVSSVSVADCSGAYTVYLVYSEGACGSMNAECDTIKLDAEGGPLPVILGRFGIQRRTAGVELHWETEQEINSSKFEVLRYIGNKGFEKIATLDAKGNSNSLSNYSFVDRNNRYTGVSIYMIKMIDIDGTYEYSKPKTVRGSTSAPEFKVFPNPTTATATIQITDLYEPVTLTVMDHSGRLVKSMSLTNSNEVKLNNLQKGNYIIRLVGKETGGTTVRQLSVLK